MGIKGYKQQIIDALDEITEQDLERMIVNAFEAAERGSPYASGANDVLGVLLGAYDAEDTAHSLEYVNERSPLQGVFGR